MSSHISAVDFGVGCCDLAFDELFQAIDSQSNLLGFQQKQKKFVEKVLEVYFLVLTWTITGLSHSEYNPVFLYKKMRVLK